MTNADSSTDTFFPAVLHQDQEIADHQGDRVLMAVRSTFFHQEIAGYVPLQSYHQGDHQEIADYGAGYGPLLQSHQGDHQWVIVQVMDLFRVLIKETIM